MLTEAAQAADVVQAQLDGNATVVADIGKELRARRPRMIITCARGSSDHAATYAKYLFESSTGLFTASAAPSIHSIYKRKMDFADSICIVISQSGASPDLLSVASAAKEGGAFVVALVNVERSPLAELAHRVLPLRAGAETSVAATKSFIASLSALAHLVSAWQSDSELLSALKNAPGLLQRAWESDWSPAIERIAACNSMFVLGRGVGLGIAQEAALKFKEVCGLHAEAFSSAEVLHGPIAIAGAAFPILVFAQNDGTKPGLDELIDKLAKRNVSLITAGARHARAVNLPTPSAHPAIEPLIRILSFYRMANNLSVRLKLDPDRPPFLQKVTATI
ncbi:MAG TPA: SIS domain-containing protein [Woeseiaceae bacterium]|nr:SIS domain-containing protein [Woeseiaceae bacterium]